MQVIITFLGLLCLQPACSYAFSRPSDEFFRKHVNAHLGLYSVCSWLSDLVSLFAHLSCSLLSLASVWDCQDCYMSSLASSACILVWKYLFTLVNWCTSLNTPELPGYWILKCIMHCVHKWENFATHLSDPDCFKRFLIISEKMFVNTWMNRLDIWLMSC